MGPAFGSSVGQSHGLPQYSLPNQFREPNHYTTFTFDYASHPPGTACFSRDEAFGVLLEIYGGYYNGRQAIVSDGSKTMADGVLSHHYHCRACDLSVPWKCSWRSQVGEYSNGTFFVFMRQRHKMHRHSLSQQPVCAKDQQCLHVTVRRLCEAYLTAEKNRCVLRVKPFTLYRHIVDVLNSNPMYSSIKYLVDSPSFFEHTKSQIANYVKYKREVYISSQLFGISYISNNDTLVRILRNWRLIIPDGYIPRDDYGSANEIATALSIEKTYQMLIYDMSHGPLYNEFERQFIRPTTSASMEYEIKMETAFLIFSPMCLYQLLVFSCQREGTRLFNADATRGLVRDFSICAVFGAFSVQFRVSYDEVTSSMRPMEYLHAAGERKWPVLMALFVLRELCWKLFRIEFLIDFGESDKAKAFYNSYLHYRNNPRACDAYIKKPKDTLANAILSDEACSLTQDEVIIPKIETSATPLIESRQPAVVTQLSQLSQSGLETDVCGSICAQPTTVNKSCSCDLDLTCLMCAFHFFQHFAKKTSFVDRFIDKSLVKNKRQNKKLIVVGSAYGHVTKIWKAKTNAERDAKMLLVQEHWTNELMEGPADEGFRNEFCQYPTNNWNIAVTGEPGCYPTGNPVESHNRKMKSDDTDLTANALLSSFLVWNAPKILQDDTNLRFDPCDIEFPDTASSLMIGVTGFMQMSRDVRAVPNGWFCNVGSNIGRPFTEDRLNNIQAAYRGDSSHFKLQAEGRVWPALKALDRMHLASNSVCFVKKQPSGKLFGDCHDCMQHLGYNCPGATLMRDEHNQLLCPLAKSRKVNANAGGAAYKASHQGDLDALYVGGISLDGRTVREMHPQLRRFSDYLTTITQGQLLALVDYLVLVVPTPLYPKRSNQMKKEELISVLSGFLSDRESYRINQLTVYRVFSQQKDVERSKQAQKISERVERKNE